MKHLANCFLTYRPQVTHCAKSPDLSQTGQTNYAPYNDTEILEQLPPAAPAPPVECRYPERENRWPPLR